MVRDPSAGLGVKERTVRCRRVRCDVLGEGFGDDLGKREDPSRPRCLRYGALPCLRRVLPLDSHCAPEEVDVLTAQGEQFTDPEAEPGLCDHRRAVPVGHGVRQRIYLLSC
jgi:hypothetical protein